MDECRCGKTGYVSKREAKHVAREVAKRDPRRFLVYRCPTSPLWHLASKHKS